MASDKPLPQADLGHVYEHAPMRELQGSRIFVNGLGWFGGWIKDCLDAHGLKPVGRGRKDNYPQPHFGQFDFAIHAASSGLKEFLDYCEDTGIKRSLYISSGAIYHGDDAYAYDKRRDEKMCGEHPANPVIARCYAFVGPRQKLDAQWAVGNFLADALAGRDIRVKSDGTALRSYMHMADLVAWLLTLLVQGKQGKPYNVGSDEAVTIADLALRVARFTGAKVVIEGKRDAINGYAHYVPSSFNAQMQLNLQTHIRLNDALARTWAWLQQ